MKIIILDRNEGYALQLPYAYRDRVLTSPFLSVVKAGKQLFEKVKYPPHPHWDRRAI